MIARRGGMSIQTKASWLGRRRTNKFTFATVPELWHDSQPSAIASSCSPSATQRYYCVVVWMVSFFNMLRTLAAKCSPPFTCVTRQFTPCLLSHPSCLRRHSRHFWFFFIKSIITVQWVLQGCFFTPKPFLFLLSFWSLKWLSLCLSWFFPSSQTVTNKRSWSKKRPVWTEVSTYGHSTVVAPSCLSALVLCLLPSTKGESLAGKVKNGQSVRRRQEQGEGKERKKKRRGWSTTLHESPNTLTILPSLCVCPMKIKNLR